MGKKTKVAIAIAAASAAAWAGSKAISKPQKRDYKEVLNYDRPIVLAHRGGSLLAPEHTMPAFEKAQSLGVDGFEIDIRLTKDEEIVVFHDETIDRTSDGSGFIKDYTLEELKSFNYGYHFVDLDGIAPYKDEKIDIVTLRELFEIFPNTYINIDIKDHPESYEGSLMPSKLWRLIEEFEAENQVVVTSFYSEQVDRFNLYAQNQVALGAGENDVRKAFTSFTSQFGHLYHPKVDVFQIPPKHGVALLDSPRFIAFLEKLNIPVHYWIIDDEETIKRLVANGAKGIVTDRPDIAISVLEKLQDETDLEN